ncbi:VOC family protein [Aquibium carbonis]|uniref:VOC family protein n=1 Tax=Aquibium carbonis TaxID=2495581 RepID=A0A429Z2X1_9HYPH|nr:VOC family protein [Aquibium carbonis]RST88049.1 VOC family protein [Aquibium carbonis]
MLGQARIGNICYYISNLDRTERFWRDVVGLHVQRIEDGDEEFLIASTAGGVDLIFFVREARPGDSPIIVFNLEDGGIDDVAAALVEQGATIVTPVSHAPGGWSGDYADPDGHVLSLYQSAEKPRRLG